MFKDIAQELAASALQAAGGNLSAAAFQQQPAAVAASPAPFRIFVEYQLDSSPLTADERSQVQALMVNAVEFLQRFLYAKSPVAGKLLAAASCEAYSGFACIRYYPEFRSGVSGADKSCGSVAVVNPNHVAAYSDFRCATDKEALNMSLIIV